MVFFKEWKDGTYAKYVNAGVVMALLGVFMFIYVVFPDQYYSATVYYNMLALCTVVLGLDYLSENNWLFAGVDFGKSLTYGGKCMLLGAGIMLVIFSTKTLSISAPFITFTGTASQFFYVVLTAPYIEETMFRRMANYTAGTVFKGMKIPYYDIAGVLFSSTFFAMFHGAVFGWSFMPMLAAFIFAIFVSVGNQLCKSAGFGFGAHVMNNLLVFMKV